MDTIRDTVLEQGCYASGLPPQDCCSRCAHNKFDLFDMDDDGLITRTEFNGSLLVELRIQLNRFATSSRPDGLFLHLAKFTYFISFQFHALVIAPPRFYICVETCTLESHITHHFVLRHSP
jgi:hypothetical protein